MDKDTLLTILLFGNRLLERAHKILSRPKRTAFDFNAPRE
jgi:hypothetical protein